MLAVTETEVAEIIQKSCVFGMWGSDSGHVRSAELISISETHRMNQMRKLGFNNYYLTMW
jgi:hypothetical protein